jgi:hypothetical protein
MKSRACLTGFWCESAQQLVNQFQGNHSLQQGSLHFKELPHTFGKRPTEWPSLWFGKGEAAPQKDFVSGAVTVGALWQH